MLFEEIDNIIWSGKEEAITQWCKRNKVYDEKTDEEIAEIWQMETPDDEETVRLNGKYVWETPSECATSSTHTMTSSTLPRSPNTRW